MKRENRILKGSEIGHFLQRHFPEWFPVDRRESLFNHLEVVWQGDKLILNAPHTNYSFGTLQEVFREAFSQISLDYQKIDRVLILGFGAGSVASILREEQYCYCPITGVEIDEEVIRLGRKYFQLDKLKNLNLHIADAEDFLLKDTSTYDFIAVDLFLDHRTPEKFFSVAFLKRLWSHLKPQGVVLFNYLLYDFEAHKKAGEFEKDFRSTFSRIQLLRSEKQPKNIVFKGKRV